MSLAIDAFVAELAARTTTHTYQDGSELLITPWDLMDGRTVTLLVEQVADNLYFVSDRGLSADRLTDASVNLDAGAGGRSWSAIRRGVTAPVMVEQSPYEIATTATRADLGRAIHDVASLVLQAEGLHVLGRVKGPLSFADRVLRQAGTHDLAIRPKAKVENRFGADRQVSFTASGPVAQVWVMALEGRGDGFMAEHDRAKVVFADARPAKPSLLSIISRDSHPQSWQVASLEAVSTVIDEVDQDSIWTRLEQVA